ncbi:MAG: RNB domain-containing ribonuclease [Sulfuriferula sp.]|nr:RNB domain-containing ribonuclease [Sulfuriferula sp.]
MYLLYEEDGQFKAGTIITDNEASLQVDTQHGKRIKVKVINVMMRFVAPSPAEFMESAQSVRDEADADFLWEVASQDEFGFADLATEYFGHVPTAIESAGILMRLHESPMHFYKKGRGRYKAAPAESLTAAKAGVERRQREAEQLTAYVAELTAFSLPDDLREHVTQLLYAPDKNQLIWKALDAACKQTGLTPLKLLDRCGAIASSHDYHLQLFLREHFPRGIGFAEVEALPAVPELPLAAVSAFSIDDASTTEIDDAFSVLRLENGNWQVGVHIAAPTLGITPASGWDQIAAQRLSTVYYPGGKITMLPDVAITDYTLSESRTAPALSMYIEVTDASWQVVGHTTRLEQVHIAANLRHELLETDFNHANLTTDCAEYAHQTELTMLWHLSGALEAARGKTPDPNLPQRVDYNFKVENDRVTITDRLRGNPIDRVVSELMIYVNAEWGKWLADTNTMALYRTQQNGKVKMSTKPGPHVGLGVAQYTWASSPLRRYVDLINQRQLIALVQETPPPYPPKSDTLYTVLRDFELAYDAYNEFQRKMERYWCLRWLQQENCSSIHANVIKENLVRLQGLPFVTRVPSLPELSAGTEVNLGIDDVDLLDVELSCSFLNKLTPDSETAPAGAESGLE